MIFVGWQTRPQEIPQKGRRTWRLSQKSSQRWVPQRAQILWWQTWRRLTTLFFSNPRIPPSKTIPIILGKHKKYGDHHEHHKKEEGEHKKGGHHESAHKEKHHKKKGESEKGHKDEEHKGYKHKKGHESHHEHKSKHGKKGGKKGGSEHGYKKGGHH